MTRIIGNADEFYRLRVVRLDAGAAPEFEWRDDILYRRPSLEEAHEAEVYRVEAVELADEDAVTTVADFETSEEAHEFLLDVQADLDEMTKSEFEDAYFQGADAVFDDSFDDEDAEF